MERQHLAGIMFWGTKIENRQDAGDPKIQHTDSLTEALFALFVVVYLRTYST
jgi:hypothetical protein